MDRADFAQIETFVGVGSVLVGKYRIERLLGVGGMGAVVEAHHEQLGQRVAIKLLLPRSGQNTRLAARFLQEARTASKLKCAHVARVFDVDSRPDGTPFMVMEYLHGESFRTRFLRDPALAARSIVDDVMEACVALAEAHSLGIVHRDLKPANLFLAEAGGGASVRVLDFGISKVLDAAADPEVITLDLPIGSPPYMSPEQLTEPATVDSRSDIWSLGVVLYEGITGHLPFEGDTFARICANVLQREPKPADRVLFAGLESIIDGCLAKKRERRFQSVEALCEALLPHAGERGKRAFLSIQALSSPSEPRAPSFDRSALPEGETQTGQSGTTLTAATSPPPRTPKRTLFVAISLGVLCLFVVAIALRVRRPPRADETVGDKESLASAARTTAPPLPSVSAELHRLPPVASVAPSAAPSSVPSPSRLVRARRRASGSGGAPSAEFDPVFEERH